MQLGKSAFEHLALLHLGEELTDVEDRLFIVWKGNFSAPPVGTYDHTVYQFALKLFYDPTFYKDPRLLPIDKNLPPIIKIPTIPCIRHLRSRIYFYILESNIQAHFGHAARTCYTLIRLYHCECIRLCIFKALRHFIGILFF